MKLIALLMLFMRIYIMLLKVIHLKSFDTGNRVNNVLLLKDGILLILLFMSRKWYMKKWIV